MRIALIGHIPHDRYILADGAPYTGFGGILYGAAALVGAMGGEGEVVLVSRIGDEISPQVARLIARYGSISPRIDTVPGYGWVVHATYVDGEHRAERLRGGVPPWTADELLRHVRGCDAVLLNMVTGFEIGLDEYEAFAAASPPLYLDFHSLALARDSAGRRTPSFNPRARRWSAPARLLQMNRAELASVVPGVAPLDAAALLSTWGPRWVAVTVGSEGAYLAEAGVAQHAAAVEPNPQPVDPTGCGDVFGACLLVGWLRGLSLPEAARAASRVARRNADHRGIPTPERIQQMFVDW